MAAGFLPILSAYEEEISYSPMLDTGDWVVLMKRPKESATGSGLLAPFTKEVWCLIILSLLVVGPVIYLLILLRSRLCKDEQYRVFPLPSCIWFVYGALLKQGTTLNPITGLLRFQKFFLKTSSVCSSRLIPIAILYLVDFYNNSYRFLYS